MSTTPNARAHLRDDDRRGRAALGVLGDEGRVVEVEQLVPVEREHRPALGAMRGGEAEAAAAAERLGLPHRLDLGAEAGERIPEDVLLPRAAGDDDARHSRVDEPRDGVLREREPADRDERLRQALRRVAEPFRLTAREDKRLHQLTGTAVAFVGRPIASYSKPAAAIAAAIEEVPPVDDERPRHRVAHLVAREHVAQLRPLRHDDRGVRAAHGVEHRVAELDAGQVVGLARPDPSRAPPRPRRSDAPR